MLLIILLTLGQLVDAQLIEVDLLRMGAQCSIGVAKKIFSDLRLAALV